MARRTAVSLKKMTMTSNDRHELHATQSDNNRLARLATYASVSVALCLIAIKTGAWLITDSVALLSSLIDSLLDVFASVVTLIAVRQAQVPADREHRFGHGKAEAIAALAQSAFVIGSAVLLLFEVGGRLLHPRTIEKPEIGIAVILVTIVLTLCLVIFQRWVVSRTGSIAIAADSLHYRGDLLMNAAVIAALVLSTWGGWALADPVFGALIAVYLAYNAWRIIREALDMLMDRELPESDRMRIYAIASAHPDAHRAHDLKTRRSGNTAFIQFHLELDQNMLLVRAHKIADEVEALIRKEFPDSEIIIHQDPEGIDEDHDQYR
jgi:ferrous-iron efflux pump FieF